MDPLFAAATLFDGYTDGVVAVTYGDKTSETSVDIECNTETGDEFQAQSGQCIWLAARQLCSRMVMDAALRSSLATARVCLELGCGVGLPGIFLAKLFPHMQVLLTDASPALLDTALRNAARNGVDARASVAVVVWGPDGVPSLDEAITRAGYACVDVVLGTDVFHSGGQYTAVPYLTTLAHLCTRWCCTGGYVLSSFRSEATTALVEAACATLGLARTVLHDTISPSATSASLKTEDVYLLEHFQPLKAPR